jgi:quercetin dioxygenase-like cupin family protein
MEPTAAGNQTHVIDAAALALNADREGVIWSISSDQLNVNLIHFAPGHGVEYHINDDVDVLGVVIAGEAILSLPHGEHELHPGSVFYLPRGAPRALQATQQPFAYISCHQRRSGLWPRPRP